MPHHEQLRRHKHLGVWSWDVVSQSASWSRALCELFGLDSRELILNRKEHRGFFVSDSFEKLEAAFHQCIRTGLSYVIDLEAIHLTGKILYLEVHGTAEHNDKGEVVLLSGVMIDRTAQANSGEALKVSSDQFSSAFQYASAGMALVSLEGKWLKVNPSLLRMLGYTEEEILEKTFQDLTHSEDLEEDLENVRRLLAGETISYQMEKRYFHKSGHIVWGLLSVSLAHSTDGSPLHFISQIQDISERKRSDEALFQRNALLEAILTSSPNGYLIVNHEGNRIAQNQRINEIFDIPPSVTADPAFKIQRQWVPSLVKDAGRFLERVHYLYSHPEEKSHDLVELKNGRLLNRYTAPLLGADGIYFGRIWIFQDITAECERQRMLQDVSEKALSADRAKSEFLAVMSHELRTPLNGILGAADLILSDPGLPSETYDKADIILSSGKALLVLLEEILDYTQIEQGRVVLQSVPFSPSSLAWEVVRLMEPFALAKSLPLEVHADRNLPGTMRGDEVRIRQVLIHLVRNAVKFTETGVVQVHIDCVSQTRDLSTIRFAVKDTGPGIPGDQHERIFLPFTQADSSFSRKHRGTGLGLAISRSLVEQMGGVLNVKSDEGKGALFSFELTFPVTTSTKEEGAIRMMNLGDLDSEFAKRFPVRILAVDDEPINLKLLVRLLGKLGYGKIFTASHGEEALQLLRQEGIDLVFMDLQMPGLDGFAATREIRALEESGTKEGILQKIFIVALTANVSSSVRSKCFQEGMNHYISKPFNTRSLAEAITTRASLPV